MIIIIIEKKRVILWYINIPFLVGFEASMSLNFDDKVLPNVLLPTSSLSTSDFQLFTF